MKVNTSSIGPTRKLLMSQEERMPKDKLLLLGKSITVTTRNGTLSILMKTRVIKPRVLTRTSVSTAADHSTLSQDFQCTELFNLMEPTMLLLTDMSKEETINNGSSTAKTRPSDQTTGRTTPWKSNPMVDHPT